MLFCNSRRDSVNNGVGLGGLCPKFYLLCFFIILKNYTYYSCTFSYPKIIPWRHAKKENCVHCDSRLVVCACACEVCACRRRRACGHVFRARTEYTWLSSYPDTTAWVRVRVNFTYYSRIMLVVQTDLIFPKLCRHNPPRPNYHRTFVLTFNSIHPIALVWAQIYRCYTLVCGFCFKLFPIGLRHAWLNT